MAAWFQVGYSRELEYRHPDGSFSAFGTSDDSGSTWLTAFVLKVLRMTRPVINRLVAIVALNQNCFGQVFSQAHSAQLLEVSPDIAGAAASWLLNEAQDKETGQFQPRGRVIHSEMVGGVQEGDASVSLSAFVTGALLEARVAKLLPESGEAALEKALSYLISAPWETNYAKVLVAHNLALASSQEPMVAVPGLKDAASQAFQEMLALGIEEGTTTHWAPKPSSSPESSSKLTKCADCYVAHASGPEVEMTGYALSAMVQTLGEAALADAFGVAKWLLSERSPSGGWRSTQVCPNSRHWAGAVMLFQPDISRLH